MCQRDTPAALNIRKNCNQEPANKNIREEQSSRLVEINATFFQKDETFNFVWYKLFQAEIYNIGHYFYAENTERKYKVLFFKMPTIYSQRNFPLSPIFNIILVWDIHNKINESILIQKLST